MLNMNQFNKRVHNAVWGAINTLRDESKLQGAIKRLRRQQQKRLIVSYVNQYEVQIIVVLIALVLATGSTILALGLILFCVRDSLGVK